MRVRSVAAIVAILGAACGDSGAGAADASLLDAAAPPDAAVVACAADYAETADPDNDLSTGGAAEATALAVSSGAAPVTVCGQIDPAQADDVTADADFYQFELAQDLRLRAELRSPDGAMASDLEMTLWLTNEGGTAVALLAEGGFRSGHGVVELGPLAAGVYAISVSAGVPEPAMPVIYTVDLFEDPDECTSAATASYAEESDGSGARGNDAVAIEFTPTAQYTAAAGTPEPTAIVLDPTLIAELTGNSADITSDGDDYRDRDAFEIATDAVTDELEIRVAWSGGADLDLFVFEPGPGDELTAGTGSVVGAGSEEHATISVAPNATYWIWVGGIDVPGAVAYEVAVCGRQFVP